MFSWWNPISQGPKPLARAIGLAVLVYVIAFGFFGWVIGPSDSDLFAAYYEIAWRFWKEGNGPWAQFNPWLGGGRPLGADPQIPVYHPIVLLVPILGPMLTVKLEMLAVLAVGAWGVVQWLRWLGVRQTQVAWGLFLYLTGGLAVCRFLVVHTVFASVFCFPALLYLSYKRDYFDSSLRKRYRVFYLLLLSYVGLYKPHLFFITAPILALESLARATYAKSWRPLLETGFALFIGALVTAVSTIPAFAYFQLYPRELDAGPFFTEPWVYLANLLLPLRTIPAWLLGWHFYQRHELNNFLGPVALFFMGWGWTAYRKIKLPEAKALLWVTVASFLFGLGASSDSWLFPFRWLGFWPGTSSLRVPPRFWFFTTFGLLYLSSLGFRWPTQKRWVTGLVIIGVLPLLGFQAINLAKTFLTKQPISQNWILPTAKWEWRKGDPDRSYESLRNGYSALDTHQNIRVELSPTLEEGPLLQTSSSEPVVGASHFRNWSEIEVTYRGKAPFVLSWNLNPSLLWHFEGSGKILSTRGGSLTVASDGPELKGTLRYQVPYLKESVAASAFGTFLLALLSFIWLKKPRFRVIGLTGGIAAGKSTYAAQLRKQGITVVDLDALGHDVLERNEKAKDAIVEAFGSEVLTEGRLDRLLLREKVFANPKRRFTLEKILHPLIDLAFEDEKAAAVIAGKPQIVCEAALLMEFGLDKKMDELIVVLAPEKARLARLLRRKGMTADIAYAIFRTQVDDSTRLARATRVIDSSR